MYPFYTSVHCLKLVTRLHCAVKRVGVRLAQSVSSMFLWTRWVYNNYDSNLALNVRSLLPPHHFCQNEFVCLLISVEHYVYHSEEKEILSTSQPKGGLTLQRLWVATDQPSCTLSPLHVQFFLRVNCTEGVNEAGESFVVAEFPLWNEILGKAKNLLTCVMWDTVYKSVIGITCRRIFPWQRYL